MTARHQLRVLAARYAWCQIGDAGTLLLLLVQAPLIGWLCTVAWTSVQRDTESLYFILCLAAVWFGCIDACREIIKERAIFERERLFGVSVWTYVGSKLIVLATLGLAQVLLMQMAVEWGLGVRGPFVPQLLALWGAFAAGAGLGLLVSALASRQDRAVGVVPLLLLPQILFSQMVIPRQYFGPAMVWAERFMPVHWGFEAFREAASVEPSWLDLGLDLLALAAYPPVLAVLTALALLKRREF